MLEKMTARPAFEDTEASFAAINDAIVQHSRWLADWSRCILCRDQIPHRYLTANSIECCGFGQWYNGEHPYFLRNMHEFIAIKALHTEVHRSVRHISRQFKKRGAVTRRAFDAFMASEKEFSQYVVQLRDELYKLLFCFDCLTGTLNRQFFLDGLEKEHARIGRTDEHCSLALLDIDNFKAVNDRYGHPTGDAVLVHTATLLRGHLRPYDLIGRYGGDEFLICLPNTDTSDAYRILDRVREDISRHPIAAPNSGPVTITASIGIAALQAERELNLTIDRADKALYGAKKHGRNNVVVYGARPPSPAPEPTPRGNCHGAVHAPRAR